MYMNNDELTLLLCFHCRSLAYKHSSWQRRSTANPREMRLAAATSTEVSLPFPLPLPIKSIAQLIRGLRAHYFGHLGANITTQKLWYLTAMDETETISGVLFIGSEECNYGRGGTRESRTARKPKVIRRGATPPPPSSSLVSSGFIPVSIQLWKFWVQIKTLIKSQRIDVLNTMPETHE